MQLIMVILDIFIMYSRTKNKYYEKINCLENEKLRSIEDIWEEILRKVKQYLETEE